MGKWIKGIDIRQHGSGNVGFTNLYRVTGLNPAIIVLLADILKGLIPDGNHYRA
jgi:glycerol-3-phosphate acyltransferase PlsY